MTAKYLTVMLIQQFRTFDDDDDVGSAKLHVTDVQHAVRTLLARVCT